MDLKNVLVAVRKLNLIQFGFKSSRILVNEIRTYRN